MTNMNEFLKHVKQSIKDGSTASPIRVVLGNESCDLDSAVSSLVYGFFLYWNSHGKNEQTSTESGIIIPVLNVSQDDLSIKTEVVFLFEKHNINLKNLILVEELHFSSIINSSKLDVTLVDHHIIDNKLLFLTPYVSEILDHRPKDLTLWPYEKNIKETISDVGSCSTLICSEILSTENGSDFLLQNINAAFLIYETIVLDTINLLSSAGRAKPLDYDMINKLEKLLTVNDPLTYRKDIYDKLIHAKADVSSLSSLQLLKKDLKVVQDIPVPGLPFRVYDFLTRQDASESIGKFCKEHNSEVILIMGVVFSDKEVERDIATCYVGGKSELFLKINRFLKEATDPSLELEELPCPLENGLYYKQRNTRATRKHVIPILKKMF